MDMFIAARQTNEIDMLREYGITNVFLEFTKNSKWSIDGDLGMFDMMWKYTSGSFKRFSEGVHMWKEMIDAVIIPLGKEIDHDNVFYEVTDRKELYDAMDAGITNFYVSGEFYRLSIKYISERARKHGIEELNFIVKTDNMKNITKFVYALAVYSPIDYAIAKRVMVYKYGKREIRSYKEFGVVDYNATFNSVNVGIDVEKIKKGNFFEIYKFNALAFWIYEVKKQRYVPKWLEEYERLKERGELPDWVYETDKRGRPKYRYLKSRYNRIQHGLYAKALSKENYICDTCPIRDKCEFFQEGSVCVFTDLWKDTTKTRNTTWVINHLGDLISEELARYLRAVYIEGMSGDVANKAITQLGDSLAKKLDLYYRLVNNKGDVVVTGSLNMDINMTMDEALERVRKMYGDELAKKVEERLNNEEE